MEDHPEWPARRLGSRIGPIWKFLLTELMKMRVNRRQKELDRWERIVGSLGFHYTSLFSEEGKKFCVCESTDDMLRYSRCVSCSHADDNNIHERQRVWDTNIIFSRRNFHFILNFTKILRDLNFVNSAAERNDKNVRSNSNQSFSSRLSSTQQSKRDWTQTPSHFWCFTHAILNRYFFSHPVYTDPIRSNETHTIIFTEFDA